MTRYSYSPAVAIDISGNLVTSGSGLIYAVDDTGGSSPLPIRDQNGTVISGGLEVTPLRLVPGFLLDDYPQVMWRSGSIAIPLSADGARVPEGGSRGQVLAKDSAEDYSVGWVDPPTGGGTVRSGTMVSTYEVNGKYTRPTTDPTVCVVFTGVSDPGTTALENDRWERI